MIVLTIAFIYVLIGALFTYLGTSGIPIGKFKIEFTNVNDDGEYLGLRNILWSIIHWPMIVILFAYDIIRYYIERES